MKIFLDSFFYQLHPGPSDIFYDYLTVPDNCDIVGVSFYNNNLGQAVDVLEFLIPKTKKLLVNLSEPTNVDFVSTLLQRYQQPNVHLFSDIVCNFAPAENFETIVSWFIYPENFYATKSWAQSRLQQLTFGNKPMKFDCLLGTEKSHRNIIETLYLHNQYRDQIIFNYYKDNADNGIWDSDVDDYFLGQDTNCKSAQVSRNTLLPVDVYNQSYYSIVAETTAYNQFCQYTEKVAKPMLGLRPFVAFAGQHYLQNLQKLGFKTFSDVIDESYDSVNNVNRRMLRAWQQVEWLCEQDPHQVLDALKPVLEHNRQHFIETDWHSAIRKHF